MHNFLWDTLYIPQVSTYPIPQLLSQPYSFIFQSSELSGYIAHSFRLYSQEVDSQQSLTIQPEISGNVARSHIARNSYLSLTQNRCNDCGLVFTCQTHSDIHRFAIKTIFIIMMIIIMLIIIIRGDGSSCLPWKVEHRAGKGRVLVASRSSVDDQMVIVMMFSFPQGPQST